MRCRFRKQVESRQRRLRFERLEDRRLLAPLIGKIPVLVTLIEEGFDMDVGFHPTHTADYYADLLYSGRQKRDVAHSRTVNFASTAGGSTGHFSGDRSFPEGSNDHFAVEITATLEVPFDKAGVWTLGVQHDEGVLLAVEGSTIIFDELRNTDSFATINLPEGPHALRLIAYNATGNSSLELFAAPGQHQVYSDTTTWELISAATNPESGADLHTLEPGFSVRQRYSTKSIDTIVGAGKLLDEPYHNVQDFFAENSNGRFTLEPITIVGPYRYDGHFDGEFGNEDRKRWSIEAADRDINFRTYDKNGDGLVTPNELIVISVASQYAGNNHRYTLRPKSDFEPGSFDRITRKNAATGLDYDVVRGRLVETQVLADYEFQYYAHDGEPEKDRWTIAQAHAHAFPNSRANAITGVNYGNGQERIVVTSPSHGLNVGDPVHLAGVPDITGNKTEFTVDFVTADTFRLEKSSGSGSYSSGGNWYAGNFFRNGGGASVRDLHESITLDGVKFPEWFAAAGFEEWQNFLTFVHEITHVLESAGGVFAGDLYNYQTVGKLPTGINYYALMGVTGNVPGSFHNDPWTKEKFGWVNPIEVVQPDRHTLGDVATTGQVLKIPRNDDEYFLVENRWGGTSYDATSTAASATVGLPGLGVRDEGLAIWHVDKTRISAFKAEKPTQFEKLPTMLWKEDAGRDAWPHGTGSDRNDLWHSRQSFDALSDRASATVRMPANSNWNDGTPSDIVIMPLSPPGPTMSVYIGFSGLPKDRLETNDTFETATRLGSGDITLGTGGAIGDAEDLTIHRTNGISNPDYFHWTAVATGEAVFKMSYVAVPDGNLSIDLHADDAQHSSLPGNATSRPGVREIRFGVDRGTSYFVHVAGVEGGIAEYDLEIDGPDAVGDYLEPNDTFATATNLGTGEFIGSGLSIHVPGDFDYYRWTAPDSGPLAVSLIFSYPKGDLDMFLYAEQNGSTEVVASALNAYQDDESIEYNVLKGTTYYLLVFERNGKPSPVYDLGFIGPSVPQDVLEPNDSLGDATILGTGRRQLEHLSIDSNDDVDYFHWVAPRSDLLNVVLAYDRTIGDLDLQLYNSVHTSVGTPKVLDGYGDAIYYDVTKGEVYYVAVRGIHGSLHFDYDLRVNTSSSFADRYETLFPDPNNDFDHATNLGTGNRTETGFSIHVPDDEDYFQWVAPDNGTLHLNLLFSHAIGDLDLRLYDDQRQQIKSSRSTTDNEYISSSVEKGRTYYVSVDSFGTAMNFDYVLRFDGIDIREDNREPNDEFGSAYSLGASDRRYDHLTVHDPGNDDYYRWTAPATGWLDLDILYVGAVGQLGLGLYRSDRSLIDHRASFNDNEHIGAAVEAGESYYIRVESRNGSMHFDYSLVIDGPDIPTDRLEPNDTPDSAAELPPQDHVESGLTLDKASGEDWYRWTATDTSLMAVNLFFDNSLGDLELSVYDSSRHRLAASSTTTDNEHVQLPVVADESYYIQVTGFSEATTPRYDLVTFPSRREDLVYVAGGDVVQVYDFSGALMNTIQHPQFASGQLGDVEIGPGGMIHVALDVGAPAGSDGLILTFTPGGSFLRLVSLPDDPSTSGYHYPVGFDVLEDGTFLVAQPNQRRIVRLRTDGKVLESYNFSPTVPIDAAVTEAGEIISSDNGQAGQAMLNTSRNGRHWVAAMNADQVWLIDRSGKKVSTRPAERPSDVQDGPGGRLFVANKGRVQPPTEPTLVGLDANGRSLFSVQLPGEVGGLAVTGSDRPAKTPDGLRDTDGDGLPDLWETSGLDVNGDGTVDLNLAELGADSNHKDLFVEVDAMVGRAPTMGTLNQVVAAFAAAPNSLIDNPDGRDGIDLHVDLDEVDIPLLDFPFRWGYFDSIKATRFGTPTQRSNSNANQILAAKRLVYRYSIFANTYSGGGSSGLAELPGNDFMVTLGHSSWPVTGGTPDQQAGTFMHELGHTLNLRHGGIDHVNYKPNYHSVMNYHWQLPGSTNIGWELDYSHTLLPTLNENNLDETIGIGYPTGSEHATNHHRVQVGPLPLRVVSESGRVDWSRSDKDGDGVVDNDTAVRADLNRGRPDRNHDGFVNSYDETPGELLHGFNDWANVQFTFGDQQNAADGVHTVTQAQEIDFATILDLGGDGADAFEPNDDSTTAANLFTGDQIHRELTIHKDTDQDWFHWTAPAAGTLTVEILFSHATSDLDLRLYDNQGNPVAESLSDTDNEFVAWNVVDGATYQIEIRSSNAATHPYYVLKIDGPGSIPLDRYESNDVIGQEAILPSHDQTLDGLTVEWTGEFSSGDDWYRWVAPKTGTLIVDARFNDSFGNLDMELFDEGEVLLRSSATSTSNEHVTYPVNANGEYLIHVFGRSGAWHPNYSLTIDGPDVLADRFEPNDCLDTAYDLGQGTRVETGLSIHEPQNDDYYRWTAPADGTLLVELTLDNRKGNLDLVLHGPGRDELAWSRSTLDFERISMAVRESGIYYFQVSGSGGAMNEEYRLSATLDVADPVPVAALYADPKPVVPGELIALNGTSSLHGDPDGRIVHYEWDFESDGVFDLSGPEPIASHHFPDEGVFDVTLRVTDNFVPAQVDTTVIQVTVAAPPTYYYINDAMVAPGDWTTAAGDDNDPSRDGRNPDAPLASIAEVLRRNDLGSSDVIRVDTGTYPLDETIVITDDDAGVTIEGYHQGCRSEPTAILKGQDPNRNVIELENADGVTIAFLKLTGGNYGIHASPTSDSDNLRAVRNEIFGNYRRGVYLDSSNDATIIAKNTFFGLPGGIIATDGQPSGIWLMGDDVLVTGNTVHDSSSYGIYTSGQRASVLANTVYDSNTGIAGSNTPGSVVNGNLVYHNRAGIGGGTLITENTVYGNSLYGITGSNVTRNVVYDNRDGIIVGYGTATENRVYHNENVGIDVYHGTATGNTVYSNRVGILGRGGWGGARPTPTVKGNLIFDNREAGVLVWEGWPARVENNTIYQLEGDGVHVGNTSEQVTLRNNIIWAEPGPGIRVEDDSQFEFDSDYNLFAPESGLMAEWQGVEFTSLTDWHFRVGQDRHSLRTDPLLVNPLGPDGILGIVDRGLRASYFANEELSGKPSVVRIEPNIDFNWGTDAPGGLSSGDRFSARWEGYLFVPTAGIYQFRSQIDDGARMFLDDRLVFDSWSTAGHHERIVPSYEITTAGYVPFRFEMRDATGPAGASLAWWGPGFGLHTIGTDSFSTGPAKPGDYSIDNDFHLQSEHGSYHGGSQAPHLDQGSGRWVDPGRGLETVDSADSPAIDRGDLSVYYLAETRPNGGRANLGAFGNTAHASKSPARLLQILSPNGLEKLELGEPIDIRWRTSGLTPSDTVALVNVGGPQIDNWLADAYRTDVFPYRADVLRPVDTTTVVDAAPAEVYESYGGAYGADGQISYHLPVPDGDYRLRLHFADPGGIGVGNRVFDVRLQGITVREQFDILKEAGAPYKATTLTFPVSVESGGGIRIELVKQSTYLPILSAIEVTATNATGSEDPKVNLNLSPNLAQKWLRIARDIGVDRFGRGSYSWSPGPVTSENTALVEVASSQDTTLRNTSDRPFLIAGNGSEYYVHSSTGEFTTLPYGVDSMSGKDPTRPMATLAALIDAYDLDAGDSVHIGSGPYLHLRNVVLTERESGVTFRGSEDGAGSTLNRGNRNKAGNWHSAVFELTGADQVTIDRLTLTGGDVGIFADTGAASDDLTVTNSTILANSSGGIIILPTSDSTVLRNNTVFGIPGGVYHDDQHVGIDLYGNNSTIEGNTVYNNTTFGIRAIGSGTMRIAGNQVYYNDTGIVALGPKVVEHNTVWENTLGIRLTSGRAVANTVFLNQDGIYGSEAELVGNRVYLNQNRGIWAAGTVVVQGNRVYDNVTGIDSVYIPNLIEDNLVYQNTDVGIRVAATGSRIRNNTIFQSLNRPLAAGVRIESGSRDTSLHNNVIWVEAGYGIDVRSNGEPGFTSDFNWFYDGAEANARAGRWGGDRNNLADWQVATGGDTRSLTGRPDLKEFFVDPDGANDELGHGSVEFVDSGIDDNFFLKAGAPAIDRGDDWEASLTDFFGQNRHDDPATPNSGSLRYIEKELGYNYVEGGIAMDWRSGGWRWNLPLPFSFPFYNEVYSDVWISSEGFLQFENSLDTLDGNNSAEKLMKRARIAPLWDDLRTDMPGDDIFVTTSPGQMTIRWDATNVADQSDVNMSVTLLIDGTIRFDYGPGNTNLSPTIGISRGNTLHGLLSQNDGQVNQTGSGSAQFERTANLTFTDIGAYEFTGSSDDREPPTLIGTNPVGLLAEGSTAGPVTRIELIFNEGVNPIDAIAAGNFTLKGAGDNGMFGDADDTNWELLLEHVNDSGTVTVVPSPLPRPPFVSAPTPLPVGKYRLRISGTTTLHDLAGLPLDGDGDGAAGGDFVKTFNITNDAPLADPGGPYTISEGDALQLDATRSTDPNAAANDRVVLYQWDLNNDGNFDVETTDARYTVGWAVLASIGLGDGPTTQIIGLQVEDRLGETDSATAGLTLANVAPIVDAGVDTSIDHGGTLIDSGVFADPGLDAWTATVDYGDGTGVRSLGLDDNKRFELSHVYAGNGTYAVTVTVSDDDGGTGSDIRTVVVTGGGEITTYAALVGADLQIEDIDAGTGSTNDTLMIRSDGTELTITDPEHRIGSTIAGATGSGTNELHIPLLSFSGNIIFNTRGGDDSLTIDGSVNSALVSDIVFHAGSGDADVLRLVGANVDIDVAQLTGVDIIDVRGSGDNTLRTDLASVLNNMDGTTDSLELRSDAGDQLVLDAGWSLTDTLVLDTIFYRVLKKSDATLHLAGPNDWQNPVDILDINADGIVVPLDALIVINELNGRALIGKHGELPPAAQFNPFPDHYLDVDGNGFCAPLDALRIINYLNGKGEGEARSVRNPSNFVTPAPIQPDQPRAAIFAQWSGPFRAVDQRSGERSRRLAPGSTHPNREDGARSQVFAQLAGLLESRPFVNAIPHQLTRADSPAASHRAKLFAIELEDLLDEIPR